MFIEVSIFQGTICEVSCTDRGSCLDREMSCGGRNEQGPGPGRTSGLGLSARLATYPRLLLKLIYWWLAWGLLDIFSWLPPPTNFLGISFYRGRGPLNFHFKISAFFSDRTFSPLSPPNFSLSSLLRCDEAIRPSAAHSFEDLPARNIRRRHFPLPQL